MTDESPHIKTLIIEDAPQKKYLTQTGFILSFIPCEDGVGYELIKVSEGGVSNRSGPRDTRTISHFIPVVISHHRMLITGNLDPKCLNIEVVMVGGPNTTMREL